MSGKPKPIPQLSREQWRELLWFAKNVVGTRVEFYQHYDSMNQFKNKIDRLYEQAKQIHNYCKEHDIDIDFTALTEQFNPSQGEK